MALVMLLALTGVLIVAISLFCEAVMSVLFVSAMVTVRMRSKEIFSASCIAIFRSVFL